MSATLRLGHPVSLLLGLSVVLASASCAKDRRRVYGEGAHPRGWLVEDDPDFHGAWLRANGDPLDRCQRCHGEDFLGGDLCTPDGDCGDDLKVSCRQSGCHVSVDEKRDAVGPATCGTCHGDFELSPLPSDPERVDAGTIGVHAAHVDRDPDEPAEDRCPDCHVVPEAWSSEGHIDDEIPRPDGADVRFSGLALTDGAKPVWNPKTRTCSGAYCHRGMETPPWNDEVPDGRLECGACHGDPVAPASHERFRRVTEDDDGCAPCHPMPPPTEDPPTEDYTLVNATHINGVVDFTFPPGCTTCHGDAEAERPSPPVALDGSEDRSARGVGAHQSHLDPTWPGRIGAVVACETCHVVPSEPFDPEEPGHLDTETPADVRLPDGGTYDPATGSCVVGCHWDRSGPDAPTWTDEWGNLDFSCGRCHDMPPDPSRGGDDHPASGLFPACLACHEYDATTHIDGHVDF